MCTKMAVAEEVGLIICRIQYHKYHKEDALFQMAGKLIHNTSINSAKEHEKSKA